jgi:hypothetical protein
MKSHKYDCLPKFNVLVIGCGQLGSRYVQGLVSIKTPLNITVVDPMNDSLEEAKKRLIDFGGMQQVHKITWLNTLPGYLSDVDLAFVATSAKERTKIICNIVHIAKIRYWVIEKLLAQSVSELVAIRQATAMSQGCWVNTPRRMMVWYASLKDRFKYHPPLIVTYSGGLWGLACNSIHFIDLVAWWSGETVVSVDTTNLGKHWIESKRTGYHEVTGELIAYFSGGSTLKLSSNQEAISMPLKVELDNGICWWIDEPSGIATSSIGDKIAGNLELQSAMTTNLADNILHSGTCDLPTLNESSAMHAIFLDAMLKNWNLSQERKDLCVPIT